MLINMFSGDYSLWLLVTICVAAILYSSVGHGGASGYLAAMALFGLDPSIMKPAALTMNIFVTVLVLLRGWHTFLFNWRLFVPVMAASIPMAYVGGAYIIEDSTYKIVVGLMLLLAVWRMFSQIQDVAKITNPALFISIPVGAVLGFVSGLTGVGGGIFLSPLLLLFHWTDVKGSIPIAAAFILLNSLAGLSGYISTGNDMPPGIPELVIIAMSGALIGTYLATQKFASESLRRALGVVLVIAGFKMILTA